MTVRRGGKKSRKYVEKCTTQLTAHHRQSYCTSFTSIREDRSTSRLAARTAHRASAPRAQHASRAIPATSTSTSTIPNSRRRRAIMLLLVLAAPSALRRTRLRLNVHRGRVRLGALPVHIATSTGDPSSPVFSARRRFPPYPPVRLTAGGVAPDAAGSASAAV